MFGVRSRLRPSAARPAARRARLCLESLEGRDCPSALSLSASVLPGHVARLSGVLSDPVPAGARVIFGGAVSGTTVTDSSGRFSFSTTNAVLGSVSAYAVDLAGAASNTATATLAVAPPTVTVAVTYGAHRTVTITGQVNDPDPGGRVVQFSGVVDGSVVTHPDGTFKLTTTPSGPGTFFASTTDRWCLHSDGSGGSLPPPPPPEIVNFTATEGTNRYWTFSGQVIDETPAGLTVNFGGIPSLEGATATTDTNGCFSYCVQLYSGESGTATAQTTDWWGQTSNVAEVFVDQT